MTDETQIEDTGTAWVTGGCAIGLILNAWDVYLRAPITAAEVRREIDRLNGLG